MSAGAPPVDCPSCRARLAQQPPQHCPACGLPLAGPVGRQLLAVDRRLAELAAERRALLARLRASGTSDGGAVASHGTGVATRSRASGTVGPFGRSLRAAGPQTLLASGGVLLLTIAAVVFTAVAWRDLSAVVRGGLIAAAALGCALATRRLVARELERTAEATAVLTVILLGVLLNGLWRAGLFELFSDGADIVTAGAAALAATSHLLAFWTGTRAPHVLTAWLAPTALVALGLRLAEALTTTSVGSAEPLVIGAAVLIAAVVAGAYAQRFVPRLARWRTATQIAGVVLWLVATLLAVIVSAELGVAVAPASTVAQSLASAALVAGAAGVALCAR
ncbi:MAG TPA: hypothetical protein VK891_03060, partial [Euzebyales bacterium]|nr:hypothetical protein [Euzebyales bacterium]